jgi:hypothetical protein
MAITHSVTRSYKDQSSVTISFAESPTADNEDNIDLSIAGSTANQLIAWVVTKANLVSIILSANVACTVYTNGPSTGAPQDTIPLVAGQALIWTAATDGNSKCPFSNNVTALYVTVAGSGACAFKLRCLKNQ